MDLQVNYRVEEESENDNINWYDVFIKTHMYVQYDENINYYFCNQFWDALRSQPLQCLDLQNNLYKVLQTNEIFYIDKCTIFYCFTACSDCDICKTDKHSVSPNTCYNVHTKYQNILSLPSIPEDCALQAYSTLTDLTKEALLSSILISAEDEEEILNNFTLYCKYNSFNFNVTIRISHFHRYYAKIKVIHIEISNIDSEDIDMILKLISKIYPFHIFDDTFDDFFRENDIFVPSLTTDDYNPRLSDIIENYTIDPKQQDFALLHDKLRTELDDRTVIFGKRYDKIKIEE